MFWVYYYTLIWFINCIVLIIIPLTLFINIIKYIILLFTTYYNNYYRNL